ncbi:MAG: zinc-binding dehydrogenase [Catenulispora sp.]|nr:zinc-binding dehydrogenase [Catenulispora sp.]
MRVIRVREFGDPSVLKLEETPDPVPGAGQAVIDVEIAGVVFGDTIVRSGRYPFPLPYVPGLEVGGLVRAVGPDVDSALVGRRVVAATPKMVGGYADQAAVDAAALCEVPEGVAIERAVPVFQAGAMALGLLDAMQVKTGETILITAAAGRIGTLLVQAAKNARMIVVAAVGGPDKAEAVSGADVVVDYSKPDWVDRVVAATGGGVDVALDAVGGEVGAGVLAALRDGAGRFGTYGFASGEWTAFDAATVGRRGLTIVGAAGVTFHKPASLQRADTVRALRELASGRLTPRIHAVWALADAAEAHTALADRRTIGAVLLKPGLS